MKAQKRAHQESCRRKRKFSRKAAAEEALLRGLAGIEFTFYRCTHCKAYHISHRRNHTQYALLGEIPWHNETIPNRSNHDIT